MGRPNIRNIDTKLSPPQRLRVGTPSAGRSSGYWACWSPYQNFGDRLTPILVRLIHKTHAQRVARTGAAPQRWVMGVGSLLSYRSLNGAVVWGTGLLHSTEQLKGKPADVRVVRGPLSRDWLVARGVRCSDVVFGDPGLLLPRWFQRAGKQPYRLAIVPHIVDKSHPWVAKQRNRPEVIVVDLAHSVERVVNDITSAEVVISSSLHGLMAADAYGIPSLWVEFGDKVWGRGFKFRDYQLAVGGPVTKAVRVSDNLTVEDCIVRSEKRVVELELDEIIRRCPTLGELR